MNLRATQCSGGYLGGGDVIATGLVPRKRTVSKSETSVRVAVPILRLKMAPDSARARGPWGLAARIPALDGGQPSSDRLRRTEALMTHISPPPTSNACTRPSRSNTLRMCLTIILGCPRASAISSLVRW